jgi:DNA gyrase subunit B
MTRLYARGRFNSEYPPQPFNGVGVCVVNALSARLDLRIWRDNSKYYQRFIDGIPQSPLLVASNVVDKRGTEITFLPSPDIFSKTEFDFAILDRQIREWGLLDPRLRIVLSDRRKAGN